MNYILIDNKKYELVKEPKCVYPPKTMWSNHSQWKMKIRSESPINLEAGGHNHIIKIDDEFKKAKFFLTGKRQLSRCRDFIIYQISCDDLSYEKVDKSDKRELLINELLFD